MFNEVLCEKVHFQKYVMYLNCGLETILFFKKKRQLVLCTVLKYNTKQG